MGRIIALANLKGGTGKSTLAVNLACLCARAHGSALLVDADPQATATAWLTDDAAGPLPDGLVVERRPAGDDADGWADRLPRDAGHHARLIIDMPPQLDAGFMAMLRVTDALLLPVTPSAIDLRATAQTLEHVQTVRKARAGRPACMLVPNRVDQRTAGGKTIQQALRELEWTVAPPVALRSSHAAAFAARRWIGAHAPGSPALREIAAVAHELEKLLARTAASDHRPGTAISPAPAAGGPAARRRGGLLASLLAGLLGRPQTG